MADNQELTEKELDEKNAINLINKLWMLLDDIDTLDDVTKDNDSEFRKQCYEIQQKRWELYNPDDVNSLYRTGKEQLTQTQQALDRAVEALHKWQSINIENGGHSCQSLFVTVKEMQKQTKAALASINKE